MVRRCPFFLESFSGRVRESWSECLLRDWEPVGSRPRLTADLSGGFGASFQCLLSQDWRRDLTASQLSNRSLEGADSSTVGLGKVGEETNLLPAGDAIRKAGCGAVSQWEGAWEPRRLRSQEDKERTEPGASPRQLGLPTWGCQPHHQGPPRQQSSAFLAPGTGSMEDTLHGPGSGDSFGMIQAHYVYYAPFFLYYTSASPQIIRH